MHILAGTCLEGVVYGHHVPVHPVVHDGLVQSLRKTVRVPPMKSCMEERGRVEKVYRWRGAKVQGGEESGGGTRRGRG